MPEIDFVPIMKFFKIVHWSFKIKRMIFAATNPVDRYDCVHRITATYWWPNLADLREPTVESAFGSELAFWGLSRGNRCDCLHVVSSLPLLAALTTKDCVRRFSSGHGWGMPLHDIFHATFNIPWTLSHFLKLLHLFKPRIDAVTLGTFEFVPFNCSPRYLSHFGTPTGSCVL